ncbi:MAG TPA: sugar phosphate isomerase/epimerase family protein [Polyangiaceae bacterium]|nr:sugar phosphate isomerase/epimerase family protein [Polyangiaceae bacterium]
MPSPSDIPIGIFAKTFLRSTPDENAGAVVAAGFHVVHYNLACAGLASMPDRIDPSAIHAARRALEKRSVAVVGLSATFNMIDPDPEKRSAGLRRLAELAPHARTLGTSLVTLCTGTRDPTDMWRGHADNATPAAWADLCRSMQQALAIAEGADVTLAIEPETANVVDSAHKAERLLGEMSSERLKIIVDPANLIRADDRHRMPDVLDAFFDRLGANIVQAHAKDVIFENNEVAHVPAGTGTLDYAVYLQLLAAMPNAVPLIIHGLNESEVPHARAFVTTQVDRAARAPVQARAAAR